MPNTYTQLYIQFVFAVKHRESLIKREWKDDLYKYVTGIVQNNKCKMLAVGGMPDHIHIFIGYKPTIAIPDLIKDIKLASGSWINDNRLTSHRFNWQEGYGAFSYRLRDVDDICRYIQDQEAHHKGISFKDECNWRRHASNDQTVSRRSREEFRRAGGRQSGCELLRRR
jgi:REP element-mobilizing transposase RayT